MDLHQKHSTQGLERLRKAGEVSGHKGKAAFLAVLRAKAEQRAIWRDPVLAAQALAELAAQRKARPGRRPKPST